MATKPQFKFSPAFKQAFQRTFEAVAHDTAACCEEAGEPCGHDEFMETVLDANRMQMYGGPAGKAADEEFAARSKEVGWEQAVKDVEATLGYRLAI